MSLKTMTELLTYEINKTSVKSGQLGNIKPNFQSLPLPQGLGVSMVGWVGKVWVRS